MPKKSLRDKAITESVKFFMPQRENWIDRLQAEDPQLAQELVELVAAWRAKDAELRAAYPSARQLTRFILSLEQVTVKEETVRKFVEGR